MSQTNSISAQAMEITASLVTYKNDPEILHSLMSSLIESEQVDIKLWVVDNSPTPALEDFFACYSWVNYYYNQGNNIGFGAAHNLALRQIEKSDYHIILNPDVFFEANVIQELINYLENQKAVGLISPKIFFPSGELQYLCKRYPSLFVLFARRFIPKPFQGLLKKRLDWYEMRETGYNRVMDVPYLSGCFMLFRKKYLDEIGYFDENIFMYLEDADITLRMSQKYRAVFYPYVHIYHHWAKGSYKSFRLMLITIQSAFYFFQKHGLRII
jgi:GT2 family glycosyltransferase